MNANKKRYIVFGCFGLFVCATIFFIVQQGNQLTAKPLPNEEEYTKKFNDFFKENYSEKVEDSSQKIAQKKALELFLLRAGERAIKGIQFYGKIVDQNGEPVSGVTIDYSGVRNILASGSGPGIVESNDSGEFFISNARGESLRFDKLTKSGYQFANLKSFETLAKNVSNAEQSWETYTKDNPFIFKAWKINRFPKVKKDVGVPLMFQPDGRLYTLSMLETNDQFSEGKMDGDIYFSFSRNQDDWAVDMTAVDGGFIETDDEFTLMAPDAGYVKKMVFSGSDFRVSQYKKLYFKSNNPLAYSVLNLRIKPVTRKERASIVMKYVINMEGGRSLVTPQRH